MSMKMMKKECKDHEKPDSFLESNNKYIFRLGTKKDNYRVYAD